METRRRRAWYQDRIKPRQIENYKEFWNDSTLVLIVPEGNVFYAQKISELETRQVYYRIEDFEKFQDIFTRVRTEDILYYKNIALQNMKPQKETNLNRKKANTEE